MFSIRENTLFLYEQPLLSSTEVKPIDDPREVGVFLCLDAAEELSRHVLNIGNVEGVRRFVCCYRNSPYWMSVAAGTRVGQVPVETQYLLIENEAGYCVLFVPLVDGAFRSVLQGSGASILELVVESGDADIRTTSVTGLFVAADRDPYALMENAAVSVSNWMRTGRLRREKMLPSFVDHFGWCTWDAFYGEVSHDKVRIGLESFAAGGVQPRYVILDDGWLSQTDRHLTAFAANDKFLGDLKPTVQMAKGEFGIETFLVWHAINGYWDGIDEEALPHYQAVETKRQFSPGIVHHVPQQWEAESVGQVPPSEIHRFFQEFHRHLREQGVDGLKVDNQASLETTGAGLGGRVALMQRYREALEGSAHVHFRGNLINCMSCSNDMLYSALNSNLTRTSDDFYPKKPETHGKHLVANAFVSLWFGEFVHPDWDMFQSGHEMGAFHAAGRAVSGGPIYVSDKPGAHDFDLLRKLVLPDGTILRAQHLGRPTRDCLFHDPAQESVLFKIFNLNEDGGVIAAFNAHYVEEGATTRPVTGEVRPADVVGLSAGRCAVYAHNAHVLRVMEQNEKWDVKLLPLGWEIFTVIPIRDGMAPIGLVDMLNSGGAVIRKGFVTDTLYSIDVRGGGRFMAWCQRNPKQVLVHDQAVQYTYGPASRLLEFISPGPCTVQILFE